VSSDPGSECGRSDIRERDGFPQRRREGRAGDLGPIGLADLQLCPRRRRLIGIDLELAQHAMNLRAAAHALDDFLSQIATLY
jgi:hypothetical protein